MSTYSLRSSEDILMKIDKQIEEKFNDFKSDLIQQFLVKEVKVEILDDLKSVLNEKQQRIVELESMVAVLQMHVQTLKQHEVVNTKSVDDLEQYGRRLCLRINGVPTSCGKISDDVLNFVKEKIIKEADVDIPENVIDRAHRIGKPIDVDGDHGVISVQSIIVRFTTLRHRTMLFKNRKKLSRVKIYLDLTKRRHAILKEAKDLVKGNENVKYVYSDINCRLKVRFIDESENFFENINNLKSILET